MNFQKILELLNYEKLVTWLVEYGIKAIFAFLFFFVLIFLIKLLSRKIEKLLIKKTEKAKAERKKRITTLTKIITNVVTVTFIFLAIIIVLGQMGINIAPILAGAGVVGLAVGFGAQSLVKDIISGFFILFENHFSVGDIVKIGDLGGQVQSMSLRLTILRDLHGNVHIIPNGSIEQVTNMTKEWSSSILDIGVAYKEDVDHVMLVLQEIGDELKTDEKFKDKIIEPFEVMGVNDFADSAVIIRCKFKTEQMTQWEVAREFRRRVKNRFDKEGIEIPFPHTTLYFGNKMPNE
ncbi:MAG: mechanosensitive ion channel domain-containing protein [Pseudomonadota bacterium]